jgi:TRAP-type mannitol/chloroaromatic compound transport system substrate-binding protein
MKDFIEGLQKLLPWIAGLQFAPKVIISIIIILSATLILLLIWTPSTQRNATENKNKTISENAESSKVAAPHEKQTTMPDLKNSMEEDWRKKLNEMYDAAKAISDDTSARNKALEEVCKEALRFKDYDFAIKIAFDISNDLSLRNTTLEEIVKHACSNQEFDSANKAAELIADDMAKKNENKKRILDAIKGNLQTHK